MHRPRLRTILLVGNLVLLALPLAGIWLLRIYESALIRQTESELIAQAAVLGAAYRQAWLANAEPGALEAQPRVDPAQARTMRGILAPNAREPMFANLDLADDPILPLPPVGVEPPQPAGLAAVAAGEHMTQVLRDVQALTLAGIRILDSAGVVIATSGGELGLSLAAQEEVATALAGLPVSTLRRREMVGERPALSSISRGADLRVFVAVPALQGDYVLGAVLVSRTPRTIDQALYHKRWPLLALAGALLAAGIAIAIFVALAVSRPIDAILAQARRAAAGERGAVVPLKGRYPQEVADLSESLASMARTLEARADYIRDFAAEVSHEFKTPLAGMHGAVELLREHLDEMQPEERHRFLDSLRENVDRLDRLVRRLLELARADVLRPSGRDCCDAAEVARAVAARFTAQDLSVQVEAPDTLPTAIDRSALETTLSNLLENVRQHAGAGASATIEVTQREGRPVLRVVDTGVGVSAGNAARIFDRFFTTARDRGGTGLGLPIARSQLGAFGGEIALLPSTRGAVFELRLRGAG
jgi:signal transduction histidine kinase